MLKTTEISSSFVANFKVGDNICYNAGVLCKLVAIEGDTFNKLIVLQAGSLIEACMSEIIFRAQRYNREGVPRIPERARNSIANRKYDKFKALIDGFRKHKLLDDMGTDIYAELHKLRVYRNKIHIQSGPQIAGAPQDEDRMFSSAVRKWALGITCAVIRFLSETYPRPKHIEGHVRNFELPCA